MAVKTYNIDNTYRNQFDWFYISESKNPLIIVDIDEVMKKEASSRNVQAKEVLANDPRNWKMNLEIKLQIPAHCLVKNEIEQYWNNTAGDPEDTLDLIRIFKIFLLEKELLDFKKCVFTRDKNRYSHPRLSREIRIFLENVYIFYQAPQDPQNTITKVMLESPKNLPMSWYYADLLNDLDKRDYQDHLKRHLEAFSKNWLYFLGSKETIDLELKPLIIEEEEWLNQEANQGRSKHSFFSIKGSKFEIEKNNILAKIKKAE